MKKEMNIAVCLVLVGCGVLVLSQIHGASAVRKEQARSTDSLLTRTGKVEPGANKNSYSYNWNSDRVANGKGYQSFDSNGKNSKKSYSDIIFKGNQSEKSTDSRGQSLDTSTAAPDSNAPQPPVVPPVTPPQPPVIPPQPPITPPTPPTPPVIPPTPLQPPLTDEEKARKLLSDLKSSHNDNVAQFTNDDGQVRTVLWTKGISAPRLGASGDFVRHDETHGGARYVTYAAAYRPEFAASGWYDTDKARGTSRIDLNLCFGAVAANQLHWWMHNNKDNINQFLAKTNYRNNLPPAQQNTLRDLTSYINSFRHQQDSRFFAMFKTYFGNNTEGFYADPLIDMVLNGHKPKPGGGYNDPDWPHNFQLDSRGGFFHDVFGKRNLTRRLVPSDFADFSNEIKKAVRSGESVGLIYQTPGRYNHIITVWGLEYDLDGKLVGIYVTDSDDQDDPSTNGMKRYNVRNRNNKPVLGNNLTDPTSGSQIDQISTLGLGEDKWAEYLK